MQPDQLCYRLAHDAGGTCDQPMADGSADNGKGRA